MSRNRLLDELLYIDDGDDGDDEGEDDEIFMSDEAYEALCHGRSWSSEPAPGLTPDDLVTGIFIGALMFLLLAALGL